MSYLALYRRFRPTTFDKVIGQEHIVKTLINQIKTGNIGHAYLFCGVRGTGKTSIAKIFAKAINCTNNLNGSPCFQCEACKTLQDPSNVDIIEIDAASNNKVENVREIRENVQYAPTNVRYKVYIIDEVHMLTTEAFNALLKTLEEPPKHAVFILATTEPQKLPATILSRCMRFDFKLIADKEIASLISSIYTEIGKKFTNEAVMAIARAGDGCVRDALSVAELCLSINEEKIEYNDVLSVLGATDISKTDSLVKNIFNGDIGKVLEITDELISLGKSIGMISKDLISYVRDIAICKTCSSANDILALPKERFDVLSSTASLCDEHKILRVLEILTEQDTALRYASKPRAIFETALIKATLSEVDYNIDTLISRITKLENQIKSLLNGEKVIVSSQAPTTIEQVEPIKNVPLKETTSSDSGEESPSVAIDEQVEIEEQKQVEIPTDTINEQKNVDGVDARKIWGTVVRRLRTTPGKIILWVACQEMTATISGNNFIIKVKNESEKILLEENENKTLITSLVNEFGSYNIIISLSGEDIASQDNTQKVTDFFGKDKITIK